MESKTQSYRGVRNSVNRKLREHAMHQEFEGLDGNGTFTPATLRKHRKAVRAKWTFRRKLDQHGEIVKAKFRLVALGSVQRRGADYLDTSSPNPIASSTRLISVLFLELGMKSTHLDIH